MITRARMQKIIESLVALRDSASDEQAYYASAIYPAWVTDHDYSVGDRVQDEDILYKCIQAHTSQASWRPSLTPALWVRISIEEWPEWIQPIGAHDAYSLGDKVSHTEKHWVSTIDYNTYEPGVYGWNEVN